MTQVFSNLHTCLPFKHILLYCFRFIDSDGNANIKEERADTILFWHRNSAFHLMLIELYPPRKISRNLEKINHNYE